MTETVTITRLGHLGDGLAPGPIVVPGALPGETVVGGLEDGRMAAPKIITSSPNRVRPPCAHSGSCGGCALQHASDDLVARWKTGLVRDALAQHNINAEIAGIATSPPGSRRRAGLAGRRTKKGALVGFHGRASHTIVPVPDCAVVTNSIRRALPVLEEMTKAGGSRKGEISFQVTDTLGGLDIQATGGKAMDLALHEQLVSLGTQAEFARLTWNDETVAQWATPTIAMGRAKVSLPPGAFLQATDHGQATLVAGVLEALQGTSRVADLFSGCGTFALPLAQTAEVWALESDPTQVAALNDGYRHTPGLYRVTAEARDLFRRPLMPDELAGLDGVVIDPPRAGAAAQITQLANSDVPTIAAVSCNPNTFARDAATLIQGGYTMGKVRVIDQFRWSPHVELAAAFSKS